MFIVIVITFYKSETLINSKGNQNDRENFFLLSENKERDVFPGLDACSLKEAVGSMDQTMENIITSSSKNSFVLFVIGGISFSEVITVQRIARVYNKKVLVVSTNMVNEDYIKKFFEQV